ncbi:MAG: protein kinase [Planctomycetes bacterium]|nr:protein kinase [Planctomycetota bacterium]
MPGKVILRATEGSIEGQEFPFEEHDTFIFGRGGDCHARLPRDDPSASRHHFIIEVSPPAARLRDLGSLNGTFVNGDKRGGRKEGQTPEEGARERFPDVDLVHGDRVSVGKTVFTVETFAPAEATGAGRVVSDAPPLLDPQSDPYEVLARLLEAVRGRGEPVPTGFAGYEVEKKLGEGGMGAVYLARRKEDGRKVALKVMLAKVAVSEEAQKAFLREVEVTRALRHPNLVEFVDHGAGGGGFFFVMEFCPGGSVADLEKERGGRLPLDEAAGIVIQALAGLAHAHEKGFVHRDLKPQNVLLTNRVRGIAKVADLGLAKNFEKAGLSGGFTVTGQSAGTPPFMPREQVTNYKYVKPACDVWSMAATLYHMVTNEFPRDFGRGEDPIAIILGQAPVPIRKRDSSIPAKVAKVIDKALSDKVADRCADAGEFKEALEGAL